MNVPESAVCPTSLAHVEAVAAEFDLPMIPAGGYLFCVRRVPLLGQPIVYRADAPSDVLAVSK